jgi:radical SAM superfamily enzyme YgiQ (UPF0313 family)
MVDAYKAGIIQGILEPRPEIIGITLPYYHAVPNALKLMKLLRDHAPDTVIVAGGSGIYSKNFDLVNDPALYGLYDYALAGEGDLAFPALLSALKGQRDLGSVHNLCYVNGRGNLRKNEQRMVRNLDALPTPDFSKHPLERYLLPEKVATFQTSRGCYYDRCKFCSRMFRGSFRQRSKALIVEDMIRIHESTGINLFQFWDSLAPIQTLHHVAREVKRRGLDFCWMAETRFEEPYTRKDYATTLREGGCRFLQFGLESASDRVLHLMGKGHGVDRIGAVLDTLSECGIQAGVFWFIGYPTETEAEADLTFDFIASRRDHIAVSAYTGTMRIGTDMIVYDELDTLGIELVETKTHSFDYRFKDKTLHYDWTERNAAFAARSDYDLLRNNVSFLYARYNPGDHLKISGSHRLGPLARHVPELEGEGTLFQRDPECHPGPYPGEGAAYVYRMITGHVQKLTKETLTLWEALREPASIQELARRTGQSESDILGLLEQGIDWGLVKVIQNKKEDG